MTTASIEVKRGDVGVTFSDTLLSNGAPIPLVGATVLFLLRSIDGETLITGTATVDDEDAATVHYVSVAGDLDLVDDYRQEWEITKSGQVLTVPSSGYNKVKVKIDLNP